MKTCIIFFCTLALVAGISGNASAQDSTISYYSASVPQIDLFVDKSYDFMGELRQVLGFGECFHLTQASGGDLDSITIGIDSTSADTMNIYVCQASAVAPSPFYLPNLNNLFDTSVKLSTPTWPSRMLTILLPHTEVSQDFAVFIQPNKSSSNGTENWIALRADSLVTEVRTAGNTHSVFEYLGGGAARASFIEFSVVDSVLIPTGEASSIYSDFDITAYVSTSTSGVAEPQSPKSVALYPNPTGTVLNIPVSMNATSVELIDMLGRTVLTQTIMGIGRVDVSHIPHGSYEAVVYSTSGIVSVPVIIQH